ncbi:hypothetical protein EYC08_01225 [Tabrizicola sp. WMC-M-20]|nr:hypothetical protein EYC08_01225 [Tabrizicola sp. WMC-M-20]
MFLCSAGTMAEPKISRLQKEERCSHASPLRVFEGKALIDAGSLSQQINAELLPLWQAMPGNTGVRPTIAGSRDSGAPEILMSLAVDDLDHSTLDASLASPHAF